MAVRSFAGCAFFAVAVVGALLWLVAAGAHGGYYAATFAATISAFLGIACYFLAEGKSIRHRIGALLGIYTALIIFFGAVHYSLFLIQPDLYASSDSIKEGKVIEEYADTYGNALDRSKALYVLALAHASVERAVLAQQRRAFFVNPGRAQIESEEGFVTLGGSNRMRLRHDQLVGAHSVTNVYWLDVRSDNFSFSMGGDVLAIVAIPTSRAVSAMHDADSADEMRLELERLIEAVRDERERFLVEIRGQIESRPEWNVVDFIYYSAVTLTTLGYGDILPNSTRARLVVLLNSVCGVFFVGFALIALWPHAPRDVA